MLLKNVYVVLKTKTRKINEINYFHLSIIEVVESLKERTPCDNGVLKKKNQKTNSLSDL